MSRQNCVHESEIRPRGNAGPKKPASVIKGVVKKTVEAGDISQAIRWQTLTHRAAEISQQ